MTLWVWDTSHYDGPITRATTDRARAEGIAVLTAKVGEGLFDTEGTQDDTTLANGRDSGIPFLGAYFVPRSTATPFDQVAYWLRLLNAGEPWWRDFPGWFPQVDLERWPYDAVPASVGIECGHRLQDAMGRRALMYASHSQYPDLAWDGPRWNADYTSRAAAGFAAMYPGDTWQPNHGSWVGGWAPYGQPSRSSDLLQFTSSATIAGLTTCDASAFRGTLDQFRTLITGGTADMLADERQWLKDLHARSNWAVSPPTVTPAQAAVGITPASETGGTPLPDSAMANLDRLARTPAAPAAGGLSDADRALIQGLTAAVTALNSRLSTP